MIEKLGRNKLFNADDIPDEVYNYGYPSILRILACLFNKMLSKIILRGELMEILLVPMIKNKTLISSESRSYRPNALPTAVSKLFELILQNTMMISLVLKPHMTLTWPYSLFKERVKNY